jgi:hypothetical protein
MTLSFLFLELFKDHLRQHQIFFSMVVFCGVLGFVGDILYICSQARSLCAMLLACIGLGASGKERKENPYNMYFISMKIY